MEQDRFLAICMCRKDDKKTGNICFMATGFNITTELSICVDVFIVPKGIEQRVTETKRGSNSSRTKDVNVSLHLMFDTPIRDLVAFDVITLKSSNNFRSSILNIFNDLIDNQPVIRDSILRHLEILIKQDTTTTEKLFVIEFLKELDTFKYGEDKVGRFQTRCVALLTCIVTFLDIRLINDIITVFNCKKEDRIIEVLLDKTREKVNKRKPATLYY